MHRPSNVLQITVVEKCVAVQLHPHPNLLDADRPDVGYSIAEEEKRGLANTFVKMKCLTLSSFSREL